MQKYRNNKHHGDTRNGKQETRRDDRPDGSRIRALDEVYVEQLSLVNNNGERAGDGLLCDAIAQRGTPTNR